MAFQYYEGTMDFVAATPAMIVTFRASGSITAGRGVCYRTGSQAGAGDVYQPSLFVSGSPDAGNVPAGVALQTVTSGQELGVLVWGYAKNLPYLGNVTIEPGHPLVLSGSYFSTSGSTSEELCHVGKCVTGSATGGTIVAFIDCMT